MSTVAEPLMPRTRKPRAPKVIPEFTILPTGGVINEQFVITTPINTSNYGVAVNVLTSPYTEYIPMFYLLKDKIDTRQRQTVARMSRIISDSIISEKESEKINLKVNLAALLTQPSTPLNNIIIEELRNFSYEYIVNEDKLNYNINNYLREDRVLESFIQDYIHSISFHHIPEHFSKMFGRVRTSTFCALVGGLSVYLQNSNGNYIPQVMCVIHPENLTYQRMHYLLKGTYDMTKMFFLVNKDLDSTSFPNKNFRSFYRKHILPEIMKYNTTVFKVPVSYMQETCSHKKVNLSSNIIERSKQIKSIISEFKGITTAIQAAETTPGIGGEQFTVNAEGWANSVLSEMTLSDTLSDIMWEEMPHRNDSVMAEGILHALTHAAQAPQDGYVFDRAALDRALGISSERLGSVEESPLTREDFVQMGLVEPSINNSPITQMGIPQGVMTYTDSDNWLYQIPQ